MFIGCGGCYIVGKVRLGGVLNIKSLDLKYIVIGS